MVAKRPTPGFRTSAFPVVVPPENNPGPSRAAIFVYPCPLGSWYNIARKGSLRTFGLDTQQFPPTFLRPVPQRQESPQEERPANAGGIQLDLPAFREEDRVAGGSSSYRDLGRAAPGGISARLLSLVHAGTRFVRIPDDAGRNLTRKPGRPAGKF